MHRYVVGFAFTEDRDKVLLVQKLRPRWQRGLLNGIGGKVERDEVSIVAMRRECKEETGLILIWKCGGVMRGQGKDSQFKFKAQNWECHFYYAYSDAILDFQQLEDEKLGLFNPRLLRFFTTVPNLDFLIPYGLSEDTSNFMILTY